MPCRGVNMKLKNQKGFTLIEVMVVIIVMALLSVLALPRVISIITQAKKASAQAVVAAVRSGIANNKIASISEGNPTGTYVAQLTNGSTNAACNALGGGNRCFDNIMEAGQGVSDSRWVRANAGGAATFRFDTGGSADCTYTYNASNGTFLPDATNATTNCQ